MRASAGQAAPASPSSVAGAPSSSTSRELAREVEPVGRLHGDARGVGAHDEQRDARLAHASRLRAQRPPADRRSARRAPRSCDPSTRQPSPSRRQVAAMPAASWRPEASSSASVAIVSPLARPGNSSAHCAAARGELDRVRRDDGAREEGSTGEAPPHLFERDAEFDEAEALSAVRLGQRESVQPEFLRHLLPGAAIETRGCLREPAHLRGRPALLEEAPHHAAKLVLFFAEREIHVVPLRCCARGLPSRGRGACACRACRWDRAASRR